MNTRAQTRRDLLARFGALGAVAVGCSAAQAAALPVAVPALPAPGRGTAPGPAGARFPAGSPAPLPSVAELAAGDQLGPAMDEALPGAFDVHEILRPALAAAEASVPLRLYNQNTRENFDVQLVIGGEWNANALKVCDWLMRDWRQNMLVDCDRRIYAALYVIQRVFSQEGRIEIHSGFRSESTNALLREMGYGAAPNSMHKQARAVDFSIRGLDHKQIARAAWQLKLGGIGLYDGWVHLDTRGTPITWGRSLG